jgi:hypothetical protein
MVVCIVVTPRVATFISKTKQSKDMSLIGYNRTFYLITLQIDPTNAQHWAREA